jgi:hypothetical protein
VNVIVPFVKPGEGSWLQYYANVSGVVRHALADICFGNEG